MELNDFKIFFCGDNPKFLLKEFQFVMPLNKLQSMANAVRSSRQNWHSVSVTIATRSVY